jgi:hypothetical protein
LLKFNPDPAGERVSEQADTSGQGQASSEPDSMVQGISPLKFERKHFTRSCEILVDVTEQMRTSISRKSDSTLKIYLQIVHRKLIRKLSRQLRYISPTTGEATVQRASR